MLFQPALFLLAALAQLAASTAALDARAQCNDNCGRAIAGTNVRPAPLAQKSADCSAFLLVYTTVTVSPTTETVYYSTPTYASACKSEAAFVSACSCLGVSETPTTTITVTLPTPTVFIDADNITITTTTPSDTTTLLPV